MTIFLKFDPEYLKNQQINLSQIWHNELTMQVLTFAEFQLFKCHRKKVMGRGIMKILSHFSQNLLLCSNWNMFYEWALLNSTKLQKMNKIS
jgi:hypothetical protein